MPVPPARHPLVRRHPGSGRQALFIAAHASHIVGWPVDEGRALLDELMAFATAPRFVHVHKWRVGDLVIWDNRCTMHRASAFASNDHKREMRRTTIVDTQDDRHIYCPCAINFCCRRSSPYREGPADVNPPAFGPWCRQPSLLILIQRRPGIATLLKVVAEPRAKGGV